MIMSRILHIVDLWQYYACCKTSGVTQCTLFMVLYLGRMCQCRLHAVLWLHIGTLMRFLAAEPRSTAELCQYLCATISVTLNSVVWNWQASRAGSMPPCWPSWSLPFCLLPFSLSLLSVYRLGLWGWGLRTDRVLIALSQQCIANFFY